MSGSNTGFAPRLDHNMALIACGCPSGVGKSDLLIRVFVNVLSANPSFREYLQEIDEQTIRDVIRSVGMHVRTEAIAAHVMKRLRSI